MKNYIFTLLNVVIGLAVLTGIPYYFGKWFLLISWLPAIFIFVVLEFEKPTL